ncbi:MAG: hypothetical protein NVSMB17_05880 [Candidatus Dormibacteria bacterium]
MSQVANAAGPEANVSATYPCPLCLRTLIPGATYAPANLAKKGTGRVWALSNTERSLVTCTRCNGTGELENRRQRSERRKSAERRN